MTGSAKAKPIERPREEKGLGNMYRHMWLTHEVARSVGVDLSAAMHDRSLDPRRYSEIVTKCRASGCDRACALHLSTLKNGQQEQVQDYCANKDLIDRLSKLKEKP